MVKEYSGYYFNNWKLQLDYHFNGYAKISREMIIFMRRFEYDNNILLDPVYTAKLMFSINSMNDSSISM